MLKRELKINLKSFIIWLLILLSIFLIGFLIYPTIIASNSVESLNEMMKMFPEEMLKAFNFDIASIDSVYGWIKSEGFVFALLMIGCYSGILGSNILLKEEDEKTIEYLNSLPITRNNIIFSKVVSGLIYIVLITLLLAIFNLFGLTLSGEFDIKQYLLLSITPIFPSIVIYFMCMFISTFTHKTKQTTGISLGIVLLSYVLQTLSVMTKETEFLKYFSVFTLADIRSVISNISINPIMIIISISLSLLFLILTVIHYNEKELI